VFFLMLAIVVLMAVLRPGAGRAHGVLAVVVLVAVLAVVVLVAVVLALVVLVMLPGRPVVGRPPGPRGGLPWVRARARSAGSRVGVPS
jgi:hypothetical protein